MKAEDEGIRPVREVRKRISADFDNNPVLLVEHYLKEQERYRDRLIPSITAKQTDAADKTARRR